MADLSDSIPSVSSKLLFTTPPVGEKMNLQNNTSSHMSLYAAAPLIQRVITYITLQFLIKK